MKKPKWATKRRYKVVTLDRKSPIINRFTNCSASYNIHGSVLVYTKNTLVSAEDGLCEIKNHNCCRGINAYKTLRQARKHMDIDRIVIIVWSNRWINTITNKCRAKTVWVGNSEWKFLEDY